MDQLKKLNGASRVEIAYEYHFDSFKINGHQNIDQMLSKMLSDAIGKVKNSFKAYNLSEIKQYTDIYIAALRFNIIAITACYNNEKSIEVYNEIIDKAIEIRSNFRTYFSGQGLFLRGLGTINYYYNRYNLYNIDADYIDRK